MSWFLMLLGLLFIGLKLTGHITWSWWLVLLPIYSGAVLVFVFVMIAAIVADLREIKPKA